MSKKQKQRLDQRILELYPHYSRAQVQSFIMQGKVTVNGTVIIKSGSMVYDDDVVVIDAVAPKYVSRAGFKLEKALDHFGITVEGLIALDAGISTGGFTDCLLQRGVAKVYGVDVGYGQVHEKVAQNPRLILMERTNLRDLPPLPDMVDIVTLDLSFISVLKVMDTVKRVLKAGGTLLVLIKPQFEAGKGEVGRGGIIKDEQVHERVKNTVKEGIEAVGFTCHGIIDSPILGGSGNKEFLGFFTKK